MEDKPRKVSLTLRVDEDMHRGLKLYTLRNNITIQDYIVDLIAKDFEQRNNGREEDAIFGQS